MVSPPTTPQPVLHVRVPRQGARAVVLVMHGGRSRSTAPVPAWSLPALRMIPFARALWRAGQGEALVVARLRFGVRGWNGAAMSPVADAMWALGQLRDRFSDVPVGLVGHSMGGRTALSVAGAPNVRSVVALAPWIEDGDPILGIADRRLFIVHGRLDRTTDPRRSRSLAERARATAEQVSYLALNGDGHAMLRRAPAWHHLAAGYSVGALFNNPVKETGGAAVTNVLKQALAGEHFLTI